MKQSNKNQGQDSTYSHIVHAHHVINLMTMTSHKISKHEKISGYAVTTDVFVSDLGYDCLWCRITSFCDFHAPDIKISFCDMTPKNSWIQKINLYMLIKTHQNKDMYIFISPDNRDLYKVLSLVILNSTIQFQFVSLIYGHTWCYLFLLTIISKCSTLK